MSNFCFFYSSLAIVLRNREFVETHLFQDKRIRKENQELHLSAGETYHSYYYQCPRAIWPFC